MTDVHSVNCPRCGGPMTASGFVHLNFGDGKGQMLALPPSCADPECVRAGQAERGEAAIQDAIKKGLIDP